MVDGIFAATADRSIYARIVKALAYANTATEGVDAKSAKLLVVEDPHYAHTSGRSMTANRAVVVHGASMAFRRENAKSVSLCSRRQRKRWYHAEQVKAKSIVPCRKILTQLIFFVTTICSLASATEVGSIKMQVTEEAPPRSPPKPVARGRGHRNGWGGRRGGGGGGAESQARPPAKAQLSCANGGGDAMSPPECQRPRDNAAEVAASDFPEVWL